MFVLFMLLYLCACGGASKKGLSADYSDKDELDKEEKISKEIEEFEDKDPARTLPKEEDDYDEAQYEGYGRRVYKGSNDGDDSDKEVNVASDEIEDEHKVSKISQANKLKNDMINVVKGVLGAARVEAESDKATIKTSTDETTDEARSFVNRRYDETELEKAIEKGTRRIFNADETANIVNYPYLAAILVSGELWCSGVIIDTDKILTTAHCLQVQYNNRFFKEFVKMISVRVGSNNATAGGEVWSVSEIYFHPHYRPTTLLYNIAVMVLTHNITFDDTVNKIDCSKEIMDLNNANITFLGWGAVDDGLVRGGQVLLQKITLPVYNHRDCQDVYGSDLVTQNNFCAGYISLPKNVCNHDAGGPAILEGRLIGLLSFTYSRCDVMDKPAVFMYVPRFTFWLNHIYDKEMKEHNVAGQ